MDTNKEAHLKFYPDVVANGGMLDWARKLLAQNTEIILAGFGTGMNYAHFSLESRSGQIFLAAEEREFSFDLWEDRKVLADGRHENFKNVVNVIELWVKNLKSAEELEAEFKFVEARSNHPKAKVKPGAYLVTSTGRLKKI